jgi:hypothetical protein
MKPALLPITMAVAAALTVAAVSTRAQAPGVYALHEVPEGATLHKVTADPAEYKGRKALKVEFTEAANKERPGVGGDMPTFVLIPTNFKNGTIEVDLLGRLNGKGLPDARAFVGLAYRVDDEARFEAVYLRPLNGRKKNPPSPRDKRAISTSPIRTGNSAGCAGSIRTGATSPAPILPTTNGSHSGSTSTTRASECRPTARRNSR